MTDTKIQKRRDYHNIEAIRALGMFIVMLFVFAICLDVGYYQAKKFDMQSSLNLAIMTGVEALPDKHRATTLTMNVANSLGQNLRPWEIVYDLNNKWLEVDKSGSYETMYLKYIGIEQVPINIHIYDFKPGI